MDKREIALVVIILLLCIQPAFASGLEINLILERETFYTGDEVDGFFLLKNTQFKSIYLYYAETKLISSSGKVVLTDVYNLSISVPPFYSGSEQVFVVIPDVPEGNYVLRIDLNHSLGSSTTTKEIMIKSKRNFANSEIKNAEMTLNSLYSIGISPEKKQYLIKAEEYLDKAKDSFSRGEYSIACDYAHISIQYSKIVLAEDEVLPAEDINYTPSVPQNKTPQIYINYSEIEKIIEKAEEMENYTPSTNPAKSFSFSYFLSVILVIVIGVSLVLIFLNARKFLTKRK